MPTNKAAFLTAVGQPLEIKDAPYPIPEDHRLVIRTRAVAINPVDHAVQDRGPDYFKWVKLPYILGCDVAGEVEAVGPDVTHFKVGDRVAGLTYATFQEHVTLPEHMTIKIPNSLSYEKASTLGMGVMITTQGLFGKGYLEMQAPSLESKQTGQTVLIWGGATSVGSNAIQLAVAAGYEVITTASPKNFDFVKKLGASLAFDYRSPTLKEDLVAAFRGKVTPGAFANGGLDKADYPGILEICAAVVKGATTCKPGRKFLSLTMVPPENLPEDVECKFVLSTETVPEIAKAVTWDFLPKALAVGKYAPVPEEKVVGKGLEALQGALNTLKAGVSATKIVVAI